MESQEEAEYNKIIKYLTGGGGPFSILKYMQGKSAGRLRVSYEGSVN